MGPDPPQRKVAVAPTARGHIPIRGLWGLKPRPCLPLYNSRLWWARHLCMLSRAWRGGEAPGEAMPLELPPSSLKEP